MSISETRDGSGSHDAFDRADGNEERDARGGARFDGFDVGLAIKLREVRGGSVMWRSGHWSLVRGPHNLSEI